MPRPVLAALLASGWLALLAVADLSVRACAYARISPRLSPAVSRIVRANPASPYDYFWLVLAVSLVVGARRHDLRVRLPAFWFALGISIVHGVIAAGMLLAGAIAGEWEVVLGSAGQLCLIVAPLAAVAYGLSRPSAKAWFAPTP